ncbi:DUF4221 family protein [Cecembia calidifontis]|uniref:Uncharacterized protein DUF4221 n=1 Tax=Cecembia calidifontis TaxID=1187080 RepID=A0A4Q7P9B3_9BACT|nr:DUF4221 family protein [Cecembia calidifontis]RZS96110.1 uncharacterized protein DUF4221 [Cecembia calidifontis]
MKGVLVYALVLIPLVACNPSPGGVSSEGFQLKDGYEINLDSYTSPVEEFFQYVTDWKGREMIAFHVRKANTIKLYDLKTGDLAEELKYSENGPNALPNIYDFHIHDQDHIFLNKRYHYTLYLVDSDFNIKNEFYFLEDDEKIDPNSGIPLSGDSFLLVFNEKELFRKFGDQIIVNGVPDKNADYSSSYEVNCLLVNLNLGSKEIKRLLGYPKTMKGNAWGVFHANLYSDFIESSNKFLLSYAADESLYLSDYKDQYLEKFAAHPKNFKRIEPLPGVAKNNDRAYLSHYNEQYIFGSVLYDEYRDLVYRVALEPNPDYGDVFVKDPLYKPRNMVVMAFDPDQDYKKVAEMRLVQNGKGVYLDRCFVNEKGLNITYVDLENEDKLYFKTFLVE